jgi:hypothetical protein
MLKNVSKEQKYQKGLVPHLAFMQLISRHAVARANDEVGDFALVEDAFEESVQIVAAVVLEVKSNAAVELAEILKSSRKFLYKTILR